MRQSQRCFSKPKTLTEHYDLVNVTGGTDIFTAEKFGDLHLELEFMVPKGSNSGMYLMGEYEVQILDSFGKPDDKLSRATWAASTPRAAPKKNACKKPGEWQKFVIDFQAPKFEGGKKTANAKFVKVTLNDVVIHENVEVKQQTPRRAHRQGSGDRPADVPGRPRPGRVPQHQDHAEEVIQWSRGSGDESGHRSRLSAAYLLTPDPVSCPQYISSTPRPHRRPETVHEPPKPSTNRAWKTCRPRSPRSASSTARRPGWSIAASRSRCWPRKAVSRKPPGCSSRATCPRRSNSPSSTTTCASAAAIHYRLKDLIKCLPADGHPMDALHAAVAALGMFYPARDRHRPGEELGRDDAAHRRAADASSPRSHRIRRGEEIHRAARRPRPRRQLLLHALRQGADAGRRARCSTPA